CYHRASTVNGDELGRCPKLQTLCVVVCMQIDLAVRPGEEVIELLQRPGIHGEGCSDFREHLRQTLTRMQACRFKLQGHKPQRTVQARNQLGETIDEVDTLYRTG